MNEPNSSLVGAFSGDEVRLPKNPRDQEVEAALDLGAVDEAVDVAGVHGLSVLGAGAFTHCGDGPALAVTT